MKEVIIILGRNESFHFVLDKKLPVSYLDFFSNSENYNGDEVKEFLISYLGEEIYTCNYPIYEIKNDHSQCIYFVEEFPYNSQFKIEVLSGILHTLNSLSIIDYDKDILFYLCHDSHFGEKVMTEKRIESNEKIEILEKLNYLLNTDLTIDNVFLATFYHDASRCKLFSELMAASSDQWNSFKIDHSLQIFDKNLLEEQKKKMINIFLPLAIDLQGLNEVKDEIIKERYLEEVLSDIKLNADEISTTWNEIKTILGMNVFPKSNPKEVLSKTFRFTQQEKKLLYLPFESEFNPGISEIDIERYFKSTEMWDEEKFLPNWLRQAVGKFDEIICKASDGNSDRE